MRLSAEEIRLRGIMLANSKELLQLHRELVMGRMVTEEEFWGSRRPQLESQDILLRQRRPPSTAQLLGVDIRPQSDIQGDLKFVLTPALIQSIFEQHPAVKQAHADAVPGRVDEKGFWMQYFTSRFFKEGLTSGAPMPDTARPGKGHNILDEYFSEALADNERIRPTEQLPLPVDILATAEDHFQAADPNAAGGTGKEERAKTATIRKLNKLSLGIVSASGLARLGGDKLVLDDLLIAHAKGDMPLHTASPDAAAAGGRTANLGHLRALHADWDQAVQERPPLAVPASAPTPGTARPWPGTARPSPPTSRASWRRS